RSLERAARPRGRARRRDHQHRRPARGGERARRRPAGQPHCRRRRPRPTRRAAQRPRHRHRPGHRGAAPGQLRLRPGHLPGQRPVVPPAAGHRHPFRSMGAQHELAGRDRLGDRRQPVRSPGRLHRRPPRPCGAERGRHHAGGGHRAAAAGAAARSRPGRQRRRRPGGAAMTSRLVLVIRLGLLAILALALTPVVRAPWPKHMTPYAARFGDASGLVPRNDVRINDVIVGRVTGVSLDGLEAVVSFEADTDVVLPDETAAEIRQTSLLGEYYLQLQPAGSGALRPRATIPASRTGRGTDLESVVALGGELTAQLNIDNLNRLIAGFDEATGGDPERVGRFLDSSAAAIGALEDLSPSLTAAIDSVDALAASLAPSTDSLAASIDRFAAGAEALQDSNDEIPNLVAGLDQLTGELEGLLQRNRERLVAASGRLRPLLDEVAANLDDLHSVVTGLAGFNRGWACAADGNYLNFVF